MDNNLDKISIKNNAIMPITATVIGLICIASGLFFNPWFLGKIFSIPGSVPISHKILIILGDIFFISLGALLLFHRKNTKIQINIFISIITILLCIILLEVSLRIILPLEKINLQQRGAFGIIQEGKEGEPYRVKPNLDISVNPGEGQISLKTNSLGLRWPEISINNPENKKRIAFAGDSQTFGLWASSTEKTFVGVFNSKVDNDSFETINFGIPGYGFAEIDKQFKSEILKFEPSYLILVSYNGNDFSDTYLHEKYPYVIKEGDLVLDEKALINNQDNILNLPIKEDLKNPLISTIKNTATAFRNSYTYVSLHNIIDNTVAKLKSGKKITFETSNIFSSTNYWSQKNYPDVAKKAVKLSLDKLENIRKLSNQNNVKLVIVTLPFRDQVYSNNTSGENYDIQFPQKYIEDYAKEKNIPYLDLLTPLRMFVQTNNGVEIYFTNNEHLNDKGHELTGEIISDFLKKI